MRKLKRGLMSENWLLYVRETAGFMARTLIEIALLGDVLFWFWHYLKRGMSA